MAENISQRLSQIIEALPVKRGMSVLEIGCGPGVVARAIVNRIDETYVLAIDRSQKAIEAAERLSKPEINSGKLKFICCKIEDFELPESEALFDLAVAIRVGVLDGRHSEHEGIALERISKCLKRGGKLFIDGGAPLKEIDMKKGLR